MFSTAVAWVNAFWRALDQVPGVDDQKRFLTAILMENLVFNSY